MTQIALVLAVTVRLAGGSNGTSGRVEVWHAGQWGSVCDDSWDDNDAAVACRQAGAGNMGNARCCAAFGQSSGPIWLDDLRCVGTEARLEECGSNGWGVHNCAHGEDAGVECYPDSINGRLPAQSALPMRSLALGKTQNQAYWECMFPLQ